VPKRNPVAHSIVRHAGLVQDPALRGCRLQTWMASKRNEGELAEHSSPNGQRGGGPLRKRITGVKRGFESCNPRSLVASPPVSRA
jgi:hypothetical protein